jgi:hypothetical protein
MSRMLPPTLPPHSPASEYNVHRALATASDDWTVLHSVRWQSIRGGRQGDGEADFVVLNRKYGVIVVEVKGGDVDMVDGVWTTINSATKEVAVIKNPFQQATESKHALLAYLKDQGLPIGQIPIAHAVAFPSITVDGGFGPAAPPEIIWDHASLPAMEDALLRTIRHWDMKAALTQDEVKNIVRLLAPTVSVRRRLVDEVGDISQRLIELTEEQMLDFRALRTFRRAMVSGGAGTGKTILAVARARKLAEDGFRPLLVCYNEPLGKELAREVADDPRIWAGTFHSLCVQSARSAGLTVPARPDEAWWKDSAPALLIDAFAKRPEIHRSVVIDEGQDFHGSWFDALQAIVADTQDFPFYLFADEHQQLYMNGWRGPGQMPPAFMLTINCRSTVPIAECASRIFGEQAMSRGTPGPVPQFREAVGRREIMRTVQRLAQTLVENEGMAESQIVVLSDDDEILESLTGVAAGSVPFVRTGRGIRLETVRRFKGLEAEIVILSMSDRTADDACRAVAYTGITRAKSALYVVGSKALKERLAWKG